MQNVMLSNEDEESPLAKVASIIGDVFDVVNSEKKDELFDAGNPTETITARISRTDVWDALSEFAIPHIHYSCEEIFAGKVGFYFWSGTDFKFENCKISNSIMV